MTLEDAVSQYELGTPLDPLAKAMHVDRNTLAKMLRGKGVTIRQRGGRVGQKYKKDGMPTQHTSGWDAARAGELLRRRL